MCAPVASVKRPRSVLYMHSNGRAQYVALKQWACALHSIYIANLKGI